MSTHVSPSRRRRSPSDSRTRSRSPTRHDSTRHSKRHRNREDHNRDRHRHRHSDRERHSHSHRRSRTTESDPDRNPPTLPFQARELTKRDLGVYEPMFAMYLDIQKGLVLEDLSEEEVKGRWKSFIRRWNRGELAEGWYDPATLEKARRNGSVLSRASVDYDRRGGRDRDRDRGRAEMESDFNGTESRGRRGVGYDAEEEEEEEDDDEEYGPTLPQAVFSDHRGGQAAGPTIPTVQDLELRKESVIDEAIAARHDARQQHRAEARSHRAELRHMEDEVAPRAEPGTHERRMEKRRENAAANRSFAESRRGGSPTEAAPDDELMGSGENDLEAIKFAREREARKKNERELRREEMLRARAAEREERVRRYREKEDETIGWLKTLAKQRFG